MQLSQGLHTSHLANISSRFMGEMANHIGLRNQRVEFQAPALGAPSN